MLSDARMADSIMRHERVIDVGVLRMNMENAGAIGAHVRHRINELAHKMARIPFDAEVFTFALVEEPVPHRRLREHVVAHNRQVIRAHRTMFKGDANAFAIGMLRNRFPELY